MITIKINGRCIVSLFHVTVAMPSVTMETLDIQTVGQSLTLQCNATTVRGITSRVDIVWSSNGSILKRIEGLNYSTTSNDSVLYTNYYTISQLNTADEDRNIQCEIYINAKSLVTMSDTVTLNVTSKYNYN